MPPNAFSDLFAYITTLMTTHASMFEVLGLRLYGAFAVIAIVWFGLQSALSGNGFPMNEFAKLVLTISFGFAMTRFYSLPIPGFGVSFYHLIVDQGTWMANAINAAMVTQVMDRLDLLYLGLATPGVSAILNVMEIVRWAIIVLAIVFAEGAVFLVISFGYIAVAVGVLLGPVFIAFFILPTMEWVFWGWLRALLQYSFYPVFANAYVFVLGSMLINFTDKAGTDFNGPRIALMFIPLLFMLMSLALGVLRVPSVCNSYFSGKSGESAFPKLW